MSSCRATNAKLVDVAALKKVLEILPDDARDGLLFVALTGLRYGELRRFRADFVQAAPPGAVVGFVAVLPAESTKTRRERLIGLPPMAYEIVQRRSRIVPTGTPLFPRVAYRKTIVRACAKAGLGTVTLRDLRHTYATLGLWGTADAAGVQAALGHTELATTQRYQSSTIARTSAVAAHVEAKFREQVSGSMPRDVSENSDKTARPTGIEPVTPGLEGQKTNIKQLFLALKRYTDALPLAPEYTWTWEQGAGACAPSDVFVLGAIFGVLFWDTLRNS